MSTSLKRAAALAAKIDTSRGVVIAEAGTRALHLTAAVTLLSIRLLSACIQSAGPK
jgi:hypothetical protein